MTERAAGDLVRRIPQSRIVDLESDLAGKLDASAGPLLYQGTWNASTDTPSIPSAASGNKGHVYVVATAGDTDIDGTTDWQVGDWLVSNGSTWDKVDNTEPNVAAAIAAATGTDEGDIPVLGSGGQLPAGMIPAGAGGATWALVDEDGTMTANVFEIVSGSTATRTRDLPSPLVVGQRYAIHAVGGSARMGANGNAIRHNQTDIGGDLLIEAGETGHVVADSTSTAEIL